MKRNFEDRPGGIHHESDQRHKSDRLPRIRDLAPGDTTSYNGRPIILPGARLCARGFDFLPGVPTSVPGIPISVPVWHPTSTVYRARSPDFAPLYPEPRHPTRVVYRAHSPDLAPGMPTFYPEFRPSCPEPRPLGSKPTRNTDILPGVPTIVPVTLTFYSEYRT